MTLPAGTILGATRDYYFGDLPIERPHRRKDGLTIERPRAEQLGRTGARIAMTGAARRNRAANRVMTPELLSRAIETLRANPGIRAGRLARIVGLSMVRGAELAESLTYFDARVYQDDEQPAGLFYDEGRA